VGDFTDLKNLAVYADDKHAHVISIEPIQPIFSTEDWNQISYASRSFISPTYIDIELVPDYIESEDIHRHVLAPAFQAKLAALRAETYVNLADSLTLKLSVLQLCYQHFREVHLSANTERAVAFRSFQNQMGEQLRLFALFEALREKLEPAGAKSGL
jgi:4-alpha-glucanotransferase